MKWVLSCLMQNQGLAKKQEPFIYIGTETEKMVKVILKIKGDYY